MSFQPRWRSGVVVDHASLLVASNTCTSNVGSPVVGLLLTYRRSAVGVVVVVGERVVPTLR
jgi:hypothetical protein